jgi:hypothetical protein
LKFDRCSIVGVTRFQHNQLISVVSRFRGMDVLSQAIALSLPHPDRAGQYFIYIINFKWLNRVLLVGSANA